MTAPRSSKPSFASLLRSMSRRQDDEEEAVPTADPPGSFRVDPARVRLWSGLQGPTPEECRDRITVIAREGQREPVTVRPVFDDALFEYEVIAGARDWVAVRHLRDVAIPHLDLLVRVELVDDDGAGQLATEAPALLQPVLPEPIVAALGGEALPADVAADLAERLDGPLAPAILATARQIARAQDARRSDGLPPYPAGEVMRLIDAVGLADAPPPLDVSLSIVDASANGVTFRIGAEDQLPPETLARVVKAMIDGAAEDGIAVTWATDPTAATSP
ncbi:MAG: ParB N-terminal domain-containing protein [Sphingomonas sp.]|uniref:ParB N-terminal domain-containing protein n=1 Tax=Sphingomonas sp. TaxID=28214 RepID=UPI001AC2EF75|nr:ParB N-terminal domain-containing protein [Sphingomonas sp.]MBN8814050.1 ParB N-terminal domain-containing protein [Sphingomonas sp.]